jgi:error-prone DNA polymerase
MGFIVQRPATKMGLIFMTVEDETGIANLIIWSSLFEAQRRIVLSSSMVACHGLVQREGDVIHVVAQRLEDLSGLLRSLGSREDVFPLQHGRGDGATHPAGPDPRELRASRGFRIATRDFR